MSRQGYKVKVAIVDDKGNSFIVERKVDNASVPRTCPTYCNGEVGNDAEAAKYYAQKSAREDGSKVTNVVATTVVDMQFYYGDE